MGMGEPFLNYKNSIAAADLLHHSKGINMAAWRITISTAGVVTKIQQFSKEQQPYKLAVSLNGTTQNQRLKTMPITETHSFSNLIKASKDYAYNSRNRITFEYVLMDGINDHPKDAEQLIKILGSIECKLNIIPYNEIGDVYKRPSDEKIEAFMKSLKQASFPVTVRWSKGTDIDAGCGQLVTSST
jgi:23S rRNA (adenine2503-C2)-methyltransferase